MYGSASRGKQNPRDVDILIIFNDSVSKNDYFNKPYELRKILEKHDNIKFDVKGIRISEIFEKKFNASISIFTEGYSLIKKEYIGKYLGGNNYSLFVYSLKNLNNSEKTMFQYALNGRRNSTGIIKELNGSHISSGSILIPIQNSEIFKVFLERWKINYDEWKNLMMRAY